MTEKVQENEILLSESDTLCIRERRIDLQAKNSFELYQLQHTSDYFLPCKIKEEDEFLEFNYNIHNHKPLTELPIRDYVSRLNALIQIQRILVQETDYQIPMDPNNFYIDRQRIVRVLKRDLQKTDVTEKENVKKFQALSGSLLQHQYSYEDLSNGGLNLLKSKQTNSLLDWQTLEDAKQDLLGKQERHQTYLQKTVRSVKRTPYLFMLIGLGLFFLGTVVFGGLYSYQKFWVLSPQTQALAAERSFIERDYVNVIQSLSRIEVKKLEKPEKYILASAYIRSQSIDSFNDEEKEFILSKISPEGSERILDYWIYLGRLQANEAIDIAQSLSDNQLLLYAYLQELDNVSKDTSLEGAVKSERINDLEDKIKTAAEKLGIDYEQEEQPEESGIEDITNEADAAAEENEDKKE